MQKLGFYHLLTLFTGRDNPGCELCCRWPGKRPGIAQSRFGHGLFPLAPDLSRSGTGWPGAVKGGLTITAIKPCQLFESSGQNRQSRFGHGLFLLAPDLSRSGTGQSGGVQFRLTIPKLSPCLIPERTGPNRLCRFGHGLFAFAPDLSRSEMPPTGSMNE